jgi:hypothetical protein
VPSPDDVVTTLDQTVTQVTSTPTSTTPPSTTTPTSGTPTTAAKKPAAPKTASKPIAKPGTTRMTGAAAQQMAALAGWTGPTSFDAVTPTYFAMPPATGVSAASGQAPAVAPLLMPQSTQRITPSAALTDLDKHSGSPVRGILLTLALAAAAGVGYGHLRVVRA